MFNCLKPIYTCKKCDNYISPENGFPSECNVHLCAITNEFGEPRESVNPDTSKAWLNFNEDAAKYCGCFVPIYQN